MEQDYKAKDVAQLPQTPLARARARLVELVEAPWFSNAVMALICLNAITLGLETFDRFDPWRPWLHLFDLLFVTVFVIEMVLRIAAYGPSFFRSGWNIADFVIVAGAALAASNLFAALRAFRVLRLLRVVTVVPRMRTVVRALVDSVPGIISVAIIAVLIVYVFAVIAGSLYGETHPNYFGNVFTSMYTLFQIITLEGWRDIADDVQADHPMSWIFFLTFVLVGTFTMLNLFIAIVVRVVEEEADETEEFIHEETDHVLQELKVLSAKIDELKARLPDQERP
ncbi:ion transporter [Parvularcula marina]|uniref:Ion transporter n=1 Tax=Parvularcula marina TaxID=2292771 RepID=A0A371RKU4_9PROT|nr:ion transporter [Parvularcula marina]RFB06080.1 ion transporter [Parvularcula marina]